MTIPAPRRAITKAGRALQDMAVDGGATIPEVEDELLGTILRHFQALDQSNPIHAEALAIATRVVAVLREGGE